jgi:hypothetical protein
VGNVGGGGIRVTQGEVRGGGGMLLGSYRGSGGARGLVVIIMELIQCKVD